MLLAFSIVLLVLGVFLSQFFRRSPAWSTVLEGFVAVFVGGVILLELIPHSHQRLGNETVAWVLAGLGVMTLAELWATGRQVIPDSGTEGRSVDSSWSWLAMIALLLGFGIHAFADGVALAVGELQLDGGRAGTSHDDAAGGLMLTMAVIAHRLPIGLAIGMMVLGKGRVLLVTLVLVMSTVLGYVSTTYVVDSMFALQADDFAALQALACGSLLHVVFGHPLQEMVRPRLRFAGAIGSFLCLGLLFAGSGHAHLEVFGAEESSIAHHHDDPHVDLHSAHSASEANHSSPLMGQLLWFGGSFLLLAVLSRRPLLFLCFGQHTTAPKNEGSQDDCSLA